MHTLSRTIRVAFALAVLALVTVALPAAHAAATHVVISEFATRGVTAYDEYLELYNPTASAIDLSGWKLQYKSATGSTWSDRAVMSAGASIAAHGFYLITPPINATTGYAGTVTPDLASSAWTTGLSDAGGHLHIIDASAVEVDMVGWGTANAPEGASAAPAMTVGTVSIERKALATSTLDSLWTGGAHALLGNGQDSNVNGSDFVYQSHGRNQQNAASPIEPAFANGGNGTGRATVTPSVAYTNRSLASLAIAFAQDSAYTIAQIAIAVPTAWTWSHSTSDVALSGSAFASATPSVVGETLFVAGAALGVADSGTVTFSNLTTPATKGSTTFAVRTATSGGTLTQLGTSPAVRVLDLVPIVSIHVNDASGVAAAPYAVGTEATVTGIVTANLSSTRTDVFVQDVTGGVDIYNPALPGITLAPGDSITVTGSVTQFRGLIELTADFTLLVRHATGRPVPDPLVMTCADLNATFHADYTEPNEGRLVRINGGTYNATTSTITDASGTATIFIPTSFPAVPSVFDAIGILKQYKPGTPAPGAPYTADYELCPRTPDDIIPHPGPIFLATPYEDTIVPGGATIHWTTDVASSSVVRYGLTSTALNDSVSDLAAVTTHSVVLTGLNPATVYYYSAGSADVNGENYSPVSLFCTASPATTTGQVNVYFNNTVDHTLAWLHPANGNADLTSLLVTRINNSHRSIDAAIYSLSGTVGSTLSTALINAKNRGVKVRVVCEYDNAGGSGFTALQAAGVPLINDRYDALNGGLGLMHNKFFVIDGRSGAPESVWVWTGSWNPTDPGTNNDLQNAIEVQDQALSVAYTMEFEEMWGSSTDTPNASVSRFGARKLDNTPHRFVIGGRNVESYFSPSDGANWQILKTINAAQHSIGFELLTLTRSDLAGALITRHNAGIAVRGDLDASTDTGSEFGNMVAAGLDVHVKTGYSGLLHHKYMITDANDPHWAGTVLTGSHNWSASAENSNNENTLIVRDADIANQYLQEFNARYVQFGGTDTVKVSDAGSLRVPHVLSLSQNYPNPFHGATRIAYEIPIAQKVVLQLFDVQGRVVRTLVNDRQVAGRYEVTLDARGLATGVYLCRLESGSVSQQKKLMLLK
jgi:phosphatidylserine/phosphatidylglycerophosphate/cardiolipin synthase-like enzyme